MTKGWHRHFLMIRFTVGVGYDWVILCSTSDGGMLWFWKKVHKSSVSLSGRCVFHNSQVEWRTRLDSHDLILNPYHHTSMFTKHIKRSLMCIIFCIWLRFRNNPFHSKTWWNPWRMDIIQYAEMFGYKKLWLYSKYQTCLCLECSAHCNLQHRSFWLHVCLSTRACHLAPNKIYFLSRVSTTFSPH